ncbi:unnamed protein product [Rotaria sp. Silwood1]|nr:unnamed protein product [Rotaria sp. Silwood1]CAF3340060.1 unnamed protein product [Rotaria sp. Silwood1]CAF4557582.1 unnamed protein product [Rotaria sp. Silwood1]
MFLLSLIVFTNLFLIPILFHPFNVCRHFIHIGHEPYHGEYLKIDSYESYLYKIIENPKSYIHISPSIKSENIFQRLFNILFKTNKNLSKKTYYPNLIRYTKMYIYEHDLSPFIQSFLTMYISYFLLTYFSSLVHVYRISFKIEQKSLNDIRYRAQQLIESTYIRWIIHALYWKFIGIIISHFFYVMSVKILMQRLFISYEHFHLNQDLIYSSWNFQKNIRLIYIYEGLQVFYSGILSRLIYELGITLLPRLIWWPFRSFFFDSTIKSYFRASSIELYFIQCICENFLRCFSVYLQIFARITTLDIVNQMHEHINLNNYPLLSLLRHQHMKKPWSFLLSMSLIDARLIKKGLSIFLRQAN